MPIEALDPSSADACRPPAEGKAIRQTTITAFLDSLADRTPAPGGGATTALHLGQAAALMSMVARYSTGPRYAEHAAVIDGICSAADAIREQSLHFAEADMAAFSSVIDAYRLPKSTESEVAERDRVIGPRRPTPRASRRMYSFRRARSSSWPTNYCLWPTRRSSATSPPRPRPRVQPPPRRVNVEVNLPGIPQSEARFAFIDALTSVDATVSHADRITTHVRRQLNS